MLKALLKGLNPDCFHTVEGLATTSLCFALPPPFPTFPPAASFMDMSLLWLKKKNCLLTALFSPDCLEPSEMQRVVFVIRKASSRRGRHCLGLLYSQPFYFWLSLFSGLCLLNPALPHGTLVSILTSETEQTEKPPRTPAQLTPEIRGFASYLSAFSTFGRLMNRNALMA